MERRSPERHRGERRFPDSFPRARARRRVRGAELHRARALGRRIPWALSVAPGASVRFRVTCKKSRLYHSDAVAQRLANAVSRAVTGVRTEDDSPGDDEVLERDDSALFVVRFYRDRCTVSADTSGALLHRRGYRQATAKAPLRETLAAALIAASEWDGVSPIVDPMCGSGTIPIEAALLARTDPARRIPHLRRGAVAGRARGARAIGQVRARRVLTRCCSGRDRGERPGFGRHRERARQRQARRGSLGSSARPCTRSPRSGCPRPTAGGS